MKRYFTPNFTVKPLRQNIRVWPWRLKWNISGQIGFQTTILFLLSNQNSGDENNINTWHQEPHFIQNQKPTLQALTLHTNGFAPLTRWCRDLRKGVLSGTYYQGFLSAWRGELISFSVPGETEKIAGLWFASGDQYPGWQYVRVR